MSPSSALPVRIVYRSKKISIPLLAAMEAADAWARAGLDVQRLEYVSGATGSDPLLIDGEIDFIFGSHISPYIHRANGIPIVYLGQTVNWATDVLVTREPITDLAQLRGKLLAEESAHEGSHPWGNHKLYLQRGGVDLSEVDFVGAKQQGDGRRAYEMVADGDAEATIIMPPNDVVAEELGLVVTRLPFLPMVHATTLTTMWSTRTERPDLCLAVIRAVREGIRFFKREEDAMMGIMESQVSGQLGVQNERALRGLYDITSRLLDERLYPTPAAVANAYRIAVLKDPSIQGRVNPMELWDNHLLRRADAG